MANWEISGKFFESCNCQSVCPCVILSPPTSGECKGLISWAISSGNSGDVDLSGRKVVLALHAPGTMIEGNFRVALYVDDGADTAHMEGLTGIFSGKKGGHFEILGSLIGEVIGIKQAPIDIVVDGKSRSLRIGGIGITEVTAIGGHEGADVTVNNTPLAVVPGVPNIVARNNGLTNRDFDFDWDHATGSAGFMTSFTYQG
jgi:hypothetical protein